MEWSWHEDKEVLGEEPQPVPLCASQVLRGLPWNQTRTSRLRDRRLTAYVNGIVAPIIIIVVVVFVVEVEIVVVVVVVAVL